ncbi:hypothetical protein K737_300529 [Holospora undulata HU1]|uniref:Uncharacterized protein n=1 Tax=Holospora undulata HU1 TaxID=1321371 RepID=A0A061JGC3_9PROT|nr:hypothetical protein [Holospora undulata]ETZ05051.1 hypothetical protein K737_300529 [Holospora undulata HU1]
MTDASHIKVHLHAAGAKGGNPGHGLHKRGQHEAIFGHGCPGHAGQNYYYIRYRF